MLARVVASVGGAGGAEERKPVWVNRSGEHAEPAPTGEMPDLCGLADVLDELTL